MWAQIVMQIAGQAANIIGTEMAVSGQREAGKYNRDLLYQRAKMEEQAMRRETDIATKQGRQFKASQYAAFAKGGAVPTSGTPLLTMVEQAGDIQMDILQNRRNRLIQAEGYRHQGDIAYAQAKREGYATRLAGFSQSMNMGSSMMGGGGGGGGDKKQPTLLNKSDSQPYGQFRPQMNTIAQYNRPRQF